ncbi:MAG: aminotransferase class I/II-fold pyridoxal phosphate-dependent enzyme [Desulfococcaceae bacterium]
MKRFNPEQAMCDVRREFGEHGGGCPSISRSATFTVMEPGIMPEIFAGLRGPDKDGCFLYSRHFNPTVNILNRYLSAMEGAEAAMATASGMSAISCALLQLCRAGDHIVSSRTVYGGTHALLAELLPNLGITVSFVDAADSESWEAAIRPETKVLYTEAIGNPTLKIANLPEIADIAHDRGLQFVVDNTFAPMILSPAQLGADVVVYSMTKFINGASDLIAGAICGSQELINQLMDLHTGRVMLLGPTMDPTAAFEILQRLPHLAIRMREHGRRAMAVAERLEALGTLVRYPGLPTHPQYDVMTAMMNPDFGFGGMLNLDCKTREKAEALMSRLQNAERFGLIAVSLGYFDTLMSCSGSSTSSEIPPEDQETMGLSPGLLRFSIGYTGDLEKRLEQLERAVREVGLA